MRAFAFVCLSAPALAGPGQVRPPAVKGQHVDLDESALLAATAKHPRDGALWFNLGILRAQKGETATSISAFERSIPLLSDKLPAFRNIIALELTAHDNSAALPPCRKALDLYPANLDPDLDLLQNCAIAFSGESRFSEAVGPLRALKLARPRDVAVRSALISALRGAGQTTESIAELKELFATSMLSRDQALALAKDFTQAKNDQGAQATYAYIAETWPPPVGPQKSLEVRETTQSTVPATVRDAAMPAGLSTSIAQATAMIRSERYVDTTHFLDEARAEYPNQPELEYDAALADVCLQRLSEAVSILVRLKQQGPPSARVDFLLGGSYEIQGDATHAESAYREAASLEPNNFTYYRVLAALLQKEGRFAESLGVVQHALALEPNDSQTLVLAARELEKKGSIDEAISTLEHAVRSDPTSRRAHAALAALYFRQKRTADAEQEQTVAAKLEDQRIQQWNIWGTAPGKSN